MLEQQLSELTEAIEALRFEMVLNTTELVRARGGIASPVRAMQPQLEQAIVDVHNMGANVNTAPTPTPQPIPVSPTLDHDADGLPWDERIHSSAKTKMVDGRWKLKRGVAPAVVKTVLAELRSAAPAQAPVVTQAPVQAAPQITAPAVVHQPVPQAAGPAVLAPAVMPGAVSYDEVKTRAAACSRVLGVNAGKIPQLLGQYGVDRLSSLAPEHYAAFVSGLALLEQGAVQ